VGDFKNGKKDGKGTLSWNDGDEYTGEFLKDKRHGTGTLIKTNGQKFVGKWVDGELIGK
jgi:hypothetical protein